MKVGRFITVEGLEFSVDSSQLKELTEYLRRCEITETIASEIGASADAAGFVDPEDYERAAQAAYFARRAKSLPVAAQTIIR